MEYESVAERLVENGFRLFSVTNGAKTPPRDLNWTDPANHITSPAELQPGQVNYGWPMAINGLLAIDIDTVGREDARKLTTEQLAGIWKMFCDKLQMPYHDPFTITQSGGLHYVYKVTEEQAGELGGKYLKNLPPELAYWGQFIDVRYRAYLVAPGSYVTRYYGAESQVGYYRLVNFATPPLPPQLAALCRPSSKGDPQVRGDFCLTRSYIPELDTEVAVERFRAHCEQNGPAIVPGKTHNTLVSAIFFGRDLGLSKTCVERIISVHLNGHPSATNPRQPGRGGGVNVSLGDLIDDVYPRGEVQGVGALHPHLTELKTLNPDLYNAIVAYPRFVMTEDQVLNGVEPVGVPVDEESSRVATEFIDSVTLPSAKDTVFVDMNPANWEDAQSEPLIEGVIEKQRITLVSGSPGSFKSTAVAAMCSAACHSDYGDLSGVFDPKLLTLWLSFEGGSSLNYSFQATKHLRGNVNADETRFLTAKHPPSLVKSGRDGDSVDEEAWAGLEMRLAEIKNSYQDASVLLVLDSLGAIVGTVNDKGLASQFMRRLRLTCSRLDAGAILITHPPKTPSKTDPHLVGGAQEYAALADTVYHVRDVIQGQDGAAKVFWHPTKDRLSACLYELAIDLRPFSIVGSHRFDQVHGEISKPGFRSRRAAQAAVMGLETMDFVPIDNYADQTVREVLTGGVESDGTPAQPGEAPAPADRKTDFASEFTPSPFGSMF